MSEMIKIFRFLTLVTAGLVNFIYLAVAPAYVFEYMFRYGLSDNFAIVNFFCNVATTVSTECVINVASFYDVIIYPLYFVAASVLLGTTVVLLWLVLKIPQALAVLYLEKTGDYLFIDSKKTIRFFVTILLPVIYYAVLQLVGNGYLRSELLEDFILAALSNTFVVLLLFCMTAFREKVDVGASGFFNSLPFVLYVKAVLVVTTLLMFVIPYLAFYRLETDIVQIGIFHIFLIYSVYSNFFYYKANFTFIFASITDDSE